jgi:2-alkyl-3-oxoalkanoate reductase
LDATKAAVVRIAVTGATGFVGGRVARRLATRGDDVVALVRRPTRELEDAGIDAEQVELDAITAEHLDGVDAIVHAAAGVGPDLDTARAVNRDGTRSIVDAALVAGTSRFVHISTTSVYDREAAGDTVIAEDAALVTDTQGSPTVSSSGSAYAITKAEAELEVQRGIAAGLNAAILRPPAVLGAGPTSTWGTRVPQRVLDGEPVPGPRASTYGFVAIDDLVDATLAALGSTLIDTVNVVSGHVEVGDYLDAVAALLPGDPVPQPAEGEPWRGTYATDRLPARFEVVAGRSFADAMAEIAASWAAGTGPEGPS